MTQASEDVRIFLDRFRGVPFPHASEVMALLDGETAGATIELSPSVELQKLRSTYRMRAEHLASRQSSPAFPAAGLVEMRALADAFDAADEQPVRIWHLALPSGRMFLVFELVEAQQIAGVFAYE
jgi:hypothetical protein